MTTLVLVLLCAALAMTVFNSLTAPRLETFPELPTSPRVSLLIPARNERLNLQANLSGLVASDYPNLEILVLDDHSTDGTGDVARAGGVAVSPGKNLPPDWLGKSWACQQLAERASGEILIFCDADVAVAPKAVARTVAALQSYDALSALPRQELKGWLSQAVVPWIMHLSIFMTLPLVLLPRLRSTRALVANGQWFAIRRSAYWRAGGHQSVKTSCVEDMDLARQLVAAGARLRVVLAPRDLATCMYRDRAALIDGFTKNLFWLAGGSWMSTCFVATIVVGIFCYPDRKALGLVLLIRLLVAKAFRASWTSVLLHYVGGVATAWLLLRSAVLTRQGRIFWKDRRLTVAGG